MKINRNPNIGHHYMNEYGIVLSVRKSKGMGDSLGRTSDAEKIFIEDREELERGVKSFFSNPLQDSPEQGEKIFACRYPFDDPWLYAKGNSRDHILKTIANRKLLGDHEWVKRFLKHRTKRPRISKAYTPLQKLWMITLYSKAGSWLWAFCKTIEALIQFVLMVIGRTLSLTWKTWKNPTEFCKANKDNTGYKHLNKWQKFWVNQFWVLPTFAIFYTAPMVEALESKFAKAYVGFLLRILFVEKHNYVLQRMLGRKRKFKEEDSYIPSRAGRWSMRLGKDYDRDATPYPEDRPEWNMELAYLEHYKLNHYETRKRRLQPYPGPGRENPSQ